MSTLSRRLGEWALFAGALVLIGILRAGLTLLPFRTVRSVVDRLKLASFARFATESESVRAVQSASRFIPHASCLTQSLSLEILLGLQGIEARTLFGVAKAADGRLRAHAWLEAGGRPLIGVADEHFVPLTSSGVHSL